MTVRRISDDKELCRYNTDNGTCEEWLSYSEINDIVQKGVKIWEVKYPLVDKDILKKQGIILR